MSTVAQDRGTKELCAIITQEFNAILACRDKLIEGIDWLNEAIGRLDGIDKVLRVADKRLVKAYENLRYYDVGYKAYDEKSETMIEMSSPAEKDIYRVRQGEQSKRIARLATESANFKSAATETSDTAKNGVDEIKSTLADIRENSGRLANMLETIDALSDGLKGSVTPRSFKDLKGKINRYKEEYAALEAYVESRFMLQDGTGLMLLKRGE